MITGLGVLLILAPYFFVTYFKDKTFGFFVVSLLVLVSYLGIALITLLLGIFNYPVVAGLHVSFLILAGVILLKRNFGWPIFTNVRFDWVFVAVVLIAFGNLYHVHFNYTGKQSVAVTNDFVTVQNQTYTFPYFADEWYAAAFAKDMIASQSLTFNNPLVPHESFLNVQAPFHALIAELFLLLQLDPVSLYAVIALLFSCFTIIVLYQFLVGNGVAPLSAGIASLSALYITQGGVLPGLWTLFPLTLGLVSLFIGLYFVPRDNVYLSVLALVAVVLFYPPLGLFYLVALAAHYLSKRNVSQLKTLSGYLGVAIIVCGLLLLALSRLGIDSWEAVANFVSSKLYFESFWAPAQLHAPVYVVLPPAILPLVLFGLFATWRAHTYLVATWCLCVLFWLSYLFTDGRILIEYERIILLTSYVSLLLAGFGLYWIIVNLKTYAPATKQWVSGGLIAVLTIMLLTAPTYTKNENWIQLRIILDDEEATSLPSAPPATAYLTTEDLRIFSQLRPGRFLSIPWKGTAIGVATAHIPLSIKSGTVSGDSYLFYEFMLASCEEKIHIANDLKLRYVYAAAFDCHQFETRDISSEGLTLYEYHPVLIH